MSQEPGPPGPTRFVTDQALGRHARWLRFLGYDVVVLRGARLDEAFAVAARDGRVLLTTSDRHPHRFAAVAVARVPRDVEAAIPAVAARHAPSGAPFSRCPGCNTALIRRHPLEASGEVPGRVLRAARSLAFCPGCGKWYWDGSHLARIRQALERALGRSLG